MVLFFHKKKNIPAPPKQEYVPVDLVQRIAAQGYSEPQIIAQLRQRGFSHSQIDKALSQTLKSAVEYPQQRFQQYVQQQQTPPQVSDVHNVSAAREPMRVPPEKIVPGPQSKPAVEPVKLSSADAFDLESNKEQHQDNEFTFEETPQEFLEKPETPEPSGPEITLEEIIESIVAERWQGFEEKLAAFEKRETQLESEINDLRKQVMDIIEKSKATEENIMAKLDEFGGHVSTIEGRIGSIERAFKDFVPELTENVRTMSEIVEKLKSKK